MKKIEGKPYFLDTSAIIAFWADENGADEVETILRSREKDIYLFYELYGG